MKSFSCLAVLVAAASLALGGCSYSKQFAKTASPIADQIVADMGTYVATESDAAKKAAVSSRAQVFLEAVHAGSQDTASPLWFALPGVKDDYTTYVLTDPSLQAGAGLSARRILLRNVQTLDYVMSSK